MKFWNGITALSRDPHPEVAQMAQDLMEFVRNQAVELIAAKEATPEKFYSNNANMSNSPNTNSLSLPPSPNTRPMYLVRDSTSTNASGTSKEQNADTQGNDTESVGSNSSSNEHQQQASKPIVTTKFISWAISQFARPSKAKMGLFNLSQDETDEFSQRKTSQTKQNQNDNDRDAPEFLEREWRFKRNEQLRREARDQQQRVPFSKLETQNCLCRTQHMPTIVKLHDYEPQIAVAYKDKVTIHDWNTSFMQSFVPELVQKFYQNNKFITRLSSASQQSSFNQHPLRVTSLEFVNAHDRSLILVGYDDGSLRLWRPAKSSYEESRLISAYSGLEMDQTCISGASSKSASNSTLNTCISTNSQFSAVGQMSTNTVQYKPGIVISWQQQDQVIVVGGSSKLLRLWDAEKELKIYDIVLNADSSVVSLSSSPNGIIAAGFFDGSIRLFDKRCSSQEAKFMTYREHQTSILAAVLRDDCENLISGW